MERKDFWRSIFGNVVQFWYVRTIIIQIRKKCLGCRIVTTIDTKYSFVYWSSSIFRQVDMSLKFGKSFLHIQAKSRAIKAKKFTYCLCNSVHFGRLLFFCWNFRGALIRRRKKSMVFFWLTARALRRAIGRARVWQLLSPRFTTYIYTWT